jgi:hypothetical protein
MFGSQILDIAIAMILFYLFISLICSAVREFIESLTKTRAMNIERGIRELLNDPSGMDIVKPLFDHPQLSGLFQGSYDPSDVAKRVVSNVAAGNMGYTNRKNLPSYVPASNFAIALLDITAKRSAAINPNDRLPLTQPLTLDAVRSSVALLPNDQVQRAMMAAIDRADGDLQQAQKNLEAWFNSTMDRVSGWYKRRTQFILFALGLVAAIALNLDTFAELRVVSEDKGTRDGLIAVAAKIDKDDPKLAQSLADKFQTLGVPMGWSCEAPPPPAAHAAAPAAGAPAAAVTTAAQANGEPAAAVSTWCWPSPVPQALHCARGKCVPDPDFWSWSRFWDILKMMLGWLITAAAVTLGAPFWFDTLSKFMSVRTALKPDDKKAPDTPPPSTSSAGGPAPTPPSGPPSPPPSDFVAKEWSAGYAQAGVL